MKKILILIPFAAFSALAQDNAITTALKTQFTSINNNLVKAAEKMPEESYSFKAADTVRSFGQLIGHVANANYMFCAVASGEANPNKGNIEKEKTTKADLVAALRGSVEFCGKAYDGLNDAKMIEKVKMRQNETPRVAVLANNNSHDNEHYGNLVTYMRIKGLVPPSSEPRN